MSLSRIKKKKKKRKKEKEKENKYFDNAVCFSDYLNFASFRFSRTQSLWLPMMNCRVTSEPRRVLVPFVRYGRQIIPSTLLRKSFSTFSTF